MFGLVEIAIHAAMAMNPDASSAQERARKNKKKKAKRARRESYDDDFAVKSAIKAANDLNAFNVINGSGS